MNYYFGYGSNMNLQRMKKRVGDFGTPFRGTLYNYCLCFNKVSRRDKRVGFANIIPHHGHAVEGIIFKLNDAQIRSLDAFEGYPEHYDRVSLNAYAEHGEIPVVVYIAQPDMIKNDILPTKKYLNYLLDGKEFLSDEYFSMLEQWPTFREE
ncbi:MAG: gamma-glutamylcyclotransferase [Magnetococcales bacterium]|nr:gamma-glutamylcyclotransferase [Magnetococcales bacterium]